MADTASDTDETHVAVLLNDWAAATRQGRLNDVLANHAPNVLIYDVLAPMKYESAEAYRASWGDWQPDTQCEGTFELQDLTVTAADRVAFATGFHQVWGRDARRRRIRGSRKSHLWLGEVRWIVGRRSPAHLEAD